MASDDIKYAEYVKPEDVPEDYRRSDDDWRKYIKIQIGDEVKYFSDLMEPKDVNFGRDLHWVLREINRAYTQGRADALKELAQEVEGRSEFKQYKQGFSEGSERMAVNILESIKLWVQDNKDHSLIVGAQHLANFVELIHGRKLHKAVKLPGGEND